MLMSKAGAEAYGKKIGVKWLVKDDQGNLYGGFKEYEDAENCKKRWDRDNKTNPYIDEIPTIYIEKV